MKIAIIIPARYASTRLPGKPLAMISGQTMLQRVVAISQSATRDFDNISILVATDDKRIANHCDVIGVGYMMTSADSPSGTDRVAQAVRQMNEQPDFILNMQGDAPLTPPDFLRALIESFMTSPCDAITPVTQLSWDELDTLRANKLITPFSGTTVTFNQQTGQAYWFSKTILPAIRNEQELRQRVSLSPVFRHIGLYGYSKSMLETYLNLAESPLETLEGLEQLRLLEHGYTLRCVPVDFKSRANMSGIDSPEDIQRAEQLITLHGELLTEDNS